MTKAKIGARHALGACAALLLTACSNLTVTQQSAFPSPVAFVTPAPLPKPTITPTLPPITLPTQPPPTVVPKRMPIDSTAAIGLWGGSLDASVPYTGYLDIAVGPVALGLKNTNVALVALNARQAFYGYGATVTETKATKPNWFLYDKDGKVAYATDPREPLLNIRDQDLRQTLSNDVAKLSLDYGGVLVEGIGEDLIRATAAPVFSGTKAFTEQQRRDAVEALLRSLRAAIPDKLLIVGGYAWEDGTAYAARAIESQDLGAIADGVHISEFLRSPISGTKEFKAEAAWKRDVDFLSAISADGRIVLITTPGARSDFTPDLAEQWLNYSVATYLLGKNGPRTYFQFEPRDTASSAIYPILNLPIGSPEATYTKLSSGLYQRKFSNGIVLVNPGDKTQSADLEQEYKTQSGARVKKVTLSPDTGILLLKP